MPGSTIPNAPGGEKTTPLGTDKIALSGDQFAQLANLYKALGSGTLAADTFLSGLGVYSKGITFSDTAPVDPVAGDRWGETDTGIEWIYGTYAAANRWVSAQFLFAGSTSYSGYAASNQGAPFPQAAGFGYDLYLDTAYLKFLVPTTNDGTKYWTYAWRKVSGSTAPAAGAGSLLGTLTTISLAADTWQEAASVSINAILDNTGAGAEFLFFDVTKVSTPGYLIHAAVLSYRLVHP